VFLLSADCLASTTCNALGVCTGQGNCLCNGYNIGVDCKQCPAGFFAKGTGAIPGVNCQECPGRYYDACGPGDCDEGFLGTGVCTVSGFASPLSTSPSGRRAGSCRSRSCAPALSRANVSPPCTRISRLNLLIGADLRIAFCLCLQCPKPFQGADCKRPTILSVMPLNVVRVSCLRGCCCALLCALLRCS
jgi:hypothetical protein